MFLWKARHKFLEEQMPNKHRHKHDRSQMFVQIFYILSSEISLELAHHHTQFILISTTCISFVHCKNLFKWKHVLIIKLMNFIWLLQFQGSGIVNAASLTHCRDLLGHLNRTEPSLMLWETPVLFILWRV